MWSEKISTNIVDLSLNALEMAEVDGISMIFIENLLE